MNYNISFEIAPIDEATDAIMELLKESVFEKEIHDTTFEDLECDLSDFFEDFNDETFCVIEYPYVDRAYRDSYYNYFSSKHYSYKRDSIRISLFNTEILQEQFLEPKMHSFLQEAYLGYIVLRPLKSSIFGASHINPKAFRESYSICASKSNSMVLGVKLTSEGFPHSSQDNETISCAETTIWALMEYFGNKYSYFRPVLSSEIHATLRSVTYERQLPSNGLTVDQISYALKQYGFGTRIYSFSAYGANLYKIINYYIESGIPIVLGLKADNLAHAIVAIGTKKNDFIIKENSGQPIELGNGKFFYNYAESQNKIIVQDDNLFPYAELDLNDVGANYYIEDDEDEEQREETNYQINSLIVPLYPKVYLEATVAEQQFRKLITEESFGYDFQDNFIFRMFLASSRSFKAHIAELKDMSQFLRFHMISTKMPKFIWCAEIYEKNTVSTNSKASGLIILDATEPSQMNLDPLIFAGYPDRCIFLVENKVLVLKNELTDYQYFSNLKNFL